MNVSTLTSIFCKKSGPKKREFRSLMSKRFLAKNQLSQYVSNFWLASCLCTLCNKRLHLINRPECSPISRFCRPELVPSEICSQTKPFKRLTTSRLSFNLQIRILPNPRLTTWTTRLICSIEFRLSYSPRAKNYCSILIPSFSTYMCRIALRSSIRFCERVQSYITTKAFSVLLFKNSSMFASFFSFMRVLLEMQALVAINYLIISGNTMSMKMSLNSRLKSAQTRSPQHFINRTLCSHVFFFKKMD